MKRITVIAVAFIWVSLLAPAQGVTSSDLSDRVGEILEHRLTVMPIPERFICRRQILCGPNTLTRFYSERDFRPAWSDDEGPTADAATLVKAILEADRDGLRRDDYHLAPIEDLMDKIALSQTMNRLRRPELLADLDILLTDAFLLYGSHLLTGHVNPETIQSEWLIKSRNEDLVAILHIALDTNDIDGALDQLRPHHAGYMALKDALLRYQNIMDTGGWPSVPNGPKLEKGDRNSRVRALQSRLTVSGDLNLPGQTDQDVFDEPVEEAVRSFQARHGLTVDGVVGRATLKALNVPVKKRVHQIKTNLERWRWLPHTLGWRHILINIANFQLEIVENGLDIMTMRVIVGRRFRRTPVFTGELTYMELNPFWHIPTKIAVRDIVPKIRKDPEYLLRQKIRVFQSWEHNAPEIDPESIDWFRINAKNLSFKLRQDPGPKNALGRVKFMFPNKFSVYLHDTPSQTLFQKTKRSFSSGCIRIEKPVDMAAYLLQTDSEWTRENIHAAIDSGETQIVRIGDPVPVHLLYWTAWVDSDGTVHFRDDIYGRDRGLGRALNQKPPTPEPQRAP